MNTLKLIVSNENLDDIPAEERDWNSWWYLHGELENLVGYDHERNMGTRYTIVDCIYV